MRNKGFALTELMMILLIIGIIAIVVVVTLNPYKTVRLEAAAKKIAMDLLYTKNLALSTSKWYGISFEADPVNVYIVYETDGASDKVIENPSQLGKGFVINLSGYYSGVKISSVNIGGGNKVEFHPLGTPYTDKNGSALTAAGVITVGYGGLTRTIQIAPNTGRITIP